MDVNAAVMQDFIDAPANLRAQMAVVRDVGLPDEAVAELVADQGLSAVAQIREEDSSRATSASKLR